MSQSESRKGKKAVPALVLRRLQRDLAELEREELTTVAACPCDDNLLRWHVNIAAPDGDSDLSGCYIHCVMQFCRSYPSKPPKVECMTPFPHPNIFGKYICLNMLKEYHPDKFEGWSSAYSVTSILYQLQSFFFAERIRQAYGGFQHAETTYRSTKHITGALLNFQCKECGHSGRTPFPRPAERVVAPGRVGQHTKQHDTFDRWTDLPRDCCLVFLQYLDAVSLYCASWATREWYRVFETYSLDARHNIRCFHTKLSYEEDGVILGFGFQRLGDGPMGMMRSQMDYLSTVAWDSNVRQDVWRSRLDVFVPLILNSRHGARAYSLLREKLTEINEKSPVFAIIKLMNDIVVALAKHCTVMWDSKNFCQVKCRFCSAVVEEKWQACPSCGRSVEYGFIGVRNSEQLMEVAMSEKALLGYASLHQILLYLVEKDKTCDGTARSMVEKLRRGRLAKGQTKDLGQALIVMSCVDGVCWRNVAKEFTMEGWIRKVKWFVKQDEDWNNPSCANYRDIFGATRVSLCVIMFQVMFLSLVEGTRSECLARYNRRLGRPSREMTGRLNEFCRRMVNVMGHGTFEEQYAFYWSTVGLKCPRGSDFIYFLREAVRVSAERRYHHTMETVDAYDWTTPNGFDPQACLEFRSRRRSASSDGVEERFVVPNPEEILKKEPQSKSATGRPKFEAAFFAARQGDVDELRKLLRKKDGEKVAGMTDLRGRTLLHFAVAGGHMEVVKILLEFGADPNVADNNGQSALSLAGTRLNMQAKSLMEAAVATRTAVGDVVETTEEEENDVRFAVVEIRGIPLQMASRDKIFSMVRGVGIWPKIDRRVNLTYHSGGQVATASVSVSVEDKLLGKVKKLNEFIVQGSRLSAEILRRRYRVDGEVERTSTLFCSGFAKVTKLKPRLKKIFSAFGVLTEEPFVTSDRNGRPIAFISFENAANAERARNNLNGMFRFGGFLSIQFKRPRSVRPSQSPSSSSSSMHSERRSVRSNGNGRGSSRRGAGKSGRGRQHQRLHGNDESNKNKNRRATRRGRGRGRGRLGGRQ